MLIFLIASNSVIIFQEVKIFLQRLCESFGISKIKMKFKNNKEIVDLLSEISLNLNK